MATETAVARMFLSGALNVRTERFSKFPAEHPDTPRDAAFGV